MLRVVWDRVADNYSRGSDIFLVGLGYRQSLAGKDLGLA
jgi:hypothetical protein